MAKAEVTVTVADLPQLKARLDESVRRAEAAERALAALRATCQAHGELREQIAEAVATAGEGYWARADAVLETIRAHIDKTMEAN